MRSRREFVRSMGASIAAASLAAESLAAQATSRQRRTGSERLLVDNPGHPTPAPIGIDVTGNSVRTGVATAYPHPNQFFHAKVERGKPLYRTRSAPRSRTGSRVSDQAGDA